MITIAFLDKIHLKALKWAQKAVEKDGRPILRATIFNGFTAACDGVRLHAINATIPVATEDGDEASEQNLEGLFEVPASFGIGQVIMKSFDAGEYPDLINIIPTNEPFFTIQVDPKLLADALSGMDGDRFVTLAFRRTIDVDNQPNYQPVEVFGKIGDVEAYALVMPGRKETVSTWKPTRKEQPHAETNS